MPDFNDLRRAGNRLYRGAHGPNDHAIMHHIGVGPIRAVANAIVERARPVPTDLESATETIVRRISTAFRSPHGGGTTIAIPPVGTWVERLDIMLQFPPVASNVLSALEHVLWETPVNSPWTSRNLESTSKSPQTAILYAYGIDPEAWHQTQTVIFHSGRPNTDAFVAVIERPHDDELTQIAVSTFMGIVAEGTFTEADARHRVRRDQEVLLSEVAPVAKIVPLPAFDTGHPIISLNNAAQALRSAGVVN